MKSVQMYDKAIKLDPHFSEAYNNKGLKSNYNIGISLYYLGDYEQSIQMYDNAINLYP